MTRPQDHYGVLNGTQVYAPIDVPINLCGNALSILGRAQSQAAPISAPLNLAGRYESNRVHSSQLAAPISIPINVGGIALAGDGS